MKLSPLEKAVANEYIANGYQGKLAYLTVKPNVKPITAESASSKMLNSPHVKAYITEKQDKHLAKSIASKDYLIKEAHEIGQEARQQGKLNTALNAVEAKGKLNRVYDQDNQGQEGYANLLQTLMVNIEGDVNISNATDNESIDITPK